MAVPIVSLFYTIEDAKGVKSTTRMNFPTSTDIAVLKEFARSTGTLIDAIIRGRIVDVSVGIGVENLPGTWKAAALPTADVEEGARFSWRTALGSLPSFRLPTFDEDLMLAGTREVDLADADVDAFVDRITAGLTQGLINVSPSDDRGEDITVLDYARESFTNSRN